MLLYVYRLPIGRKMKRAQGGNGYQWGSMETFRKTHFLYNLVTKKINFVSSPTFQSFLFLKLFHKPILSGISWVPTKELFKYARFVCKKENGSTVFSHMQITFLSNQNVRQTTRPIDWSKFFFVYKREFDIAAKDTRTSSRTYVVVRAEFPEEPMPVTHPFLCADTLFGRKGVDDRIDDTHRRRSLA